MTAPSEIKTWIESNLPSSEVEVSGDGRHFEAIVITPAFAGKNTLQRHRMVYEALGDKMDEAIHALQLKTLTPDESRST